MPYLNAAALRSAADAAEATPPSACHCALRPTAGWESFTEDRWPAAHVRPVGTLRDPAVDEPTTDEHHPDGTRYDSPTAPIAVRFFPCNRSDVFACSACEQVLLRYTEFGGYYVDHRVRVVSAALVA